MSIPLVVELHNELRRILIAGSEMAVGDFRLKRILPLMKKSGEGMPLFAKVADAIEKVVEPSEGRVSERLIDLANLVNAIVYTQGETSVKGEIQDIDTLEINYSTHMPYRKLYPVIEALTSKGSGRAEIIREALADGAFSDLRLINPLITALDDNYSEVGQMAFDIIKQYGKGIVPVLKKRLNINEGKACSKIVDLISHFSGADEKDLYLELVDKGGLEVKISAVKALKDIPDCEDMLVELSKDRKKEIREVSLYALSNFKSNKVAERLSEVFRGKERALAVEPLKLCKSKQIVNFLLEEGKKSLEALLRYEKGLNKSEISQEGLNYFADVVDCMGYKRDQDVFDFLKECVSHTKYLNKFKATLNTVNITSPIARIVAKSIISFESSNAYNLLISTNGKYDNSLIGFSFEAAIKSMSPEYVYENYSKYVKGGRKAFEAIEILSVMENYAVFKECDFNESKSYTTLNFPKHDGHTCGVMWDERWVKTLAAVDEAQIICRIIKEGDTFGIKYLLRKLERNKGEKEPLGKDIILGLFQAKYAKIKDVLLDVFEFYLKAKDYGRYYHFFASDFIGVVSLLNPEDATDLENMAAKYDNEVGKRLFEAARRLKDSKNK